MSILYTSKPPLLPFQALKGAGSELDACPGKNNDSGLGNITEVVVSMVGDVRGLSPEFVVFGGPPEFEVKRGIGIIGDKLACGLGVLIQDVAAHAVLPAESPGGTEVRDNGMVECCYEFVAQVLHGVVGLVDVDIIVTFLMDIGIGQIKCHSIVAGSGLDLNTQIIEVEVGAVEDIISSVHHPVYHIRTAVIEALQGVVGKHTTKLIVGLGSSARIP